MQILTDLNTKLLKTGYVNVLQSNDERKVSFEIAKFFIDNGEGWSFLLQAGASPSTTLRMTAIKKTVLETLSCELGVAAVLHK